MNINTFEDHTIEDWCKKFSQANFGSWEGIDSSNAWLRFVETATTSIAELVRLGYYGELIDALGDSFGWLCCFSDRYTHVLPGESFRFIGSLSAMIWRKYPGVCYRCTHKYSIDEIKDKKYLACVCLSTPTIYEIDKPIRTQNIEEAKQSKSKPIRLDEWTSMTKEIYGPNHREYSLSSICLHFLEEVGEVAKGLRELRELEPLTSGEIRRDKIYELQDEMADVFSWIMGLLNKIDQILSMGRIYYDAHGFSELPQIKASVVASRALERWDGKDIP